MSSIDINELVAEETGIHVGDGSMNYYRNLPTYTLACHHIDDKKFMDIRVKNLYQKVYGITIKNRKWSQGAYGFRSYDKNMVTFKEKVLRLPLGKKDRIEVPYKIREKRKLSIAFLRGFLSTDGSVNTFLANGKTPYPRIEFSNVSQILMKQINHMLKCLDFRTTVWTVQPKCLRWKKCSRISINGFGMLKKWNELVGFSNPKQALKVEMLGIQSNVFK